jgi:glycosyltransferase involved in cell wall biosynthesis
MTTKKTVILRGPLCTSSGYGVHVRQVARWLFDYSDSQGNLDVVTELTAWGNTPWIVDVNEQDGLIGRCIQSAQKRDKYDVSIQLQLPNEWNPFLADYNIGITAAVEATSCDPAWVAACNRMDLIIVPSDFVKQVIMNSGELKTRIEVVPEAFIDAVAKEQVPELDLDLTTDFNFLVFGQFTGNNPENDRKNIFYTIKWLAETFSDNPNVGIILKTNTSRNTVVDRMRTTNIISQISNETKKGNPFPKIHLLHGDMTDIEVAGLYRHPKVKALLTLTRGEGFGLPILEAAASGLPVIATGWSAHTEFLGRGKYVKLDYTLEPIHESRVDTIWQKGSKWAQVKEADVKHRLKKFVESYSVPQTWAKELAPRLQSEYSYDGIKEQYTSILGDVLK